MKADWKKAGNLLFLAIVFIATVWSVLYGEDLSDIFLYVKRANFYYLIPSFFCVILFIIGESVVLCYLMRSLGTKIPFSHCCLYSFIGFFYSCITPSASGGQPMQIVAMRKDRIPIAVSTVVLGIVTITYKMVLVVIGAGVLIIHPASISTYLEPVQGLIMLGMALNIICIIALLLLVFNPIVAQRILKWIFAVMNHIHHPKNLKKQEEKVERITTQFQGTAEYYRSHKNVIIHVFLITFLQRCLLFLVTWFVYRSFGLSGTSLQVILILQSMIAVAVDMLPLPGGMGISEHMFLMIFLPIFGEAFVLPGMILSRGISYYTQLIVSAVMTVVAAFVIKEKYTERE